MMPHEETKPGPYKSVIVIEYCNKYQFEILTTLNVEKKDMVEQKGYKIWLDYLSSLTPSPFQIRAYVINYKVSWSKSLWLQIPQRDYIWSWNAHIEN